MSDTQTVRNHDTFDLLLFDLDGTLIDSEAGIVGSMRHAFAQMQVAAPSAETLRSWIGPPLRQTFPLVVGEDSERVEMAVAHYRERFDALGWREHEAYPGIASLIQSLADAGHRLAVVTTKLQVQAQRIIDHLPFGVHFARVYGPGADGTHTEKSAMIAQALRDFGADAARTAMIGDRHFDMHGACENAVTAIGVTWGFGDRDELLGAGAIAIADSTEHLQQLIRSIPIKPPVDA